MKLEVQLRPGLARVSLPTHHHAGVGGGFTVHSRNGGAGRQLEIAIEGTAAATMRADSAITGGHFVLDIPVGRPVLTRAGNVDFGRVASVLAVGVQLMVAARCDGVSTKIVVRPASDLVTEHAGVDDTITLRGGRTYTVHIQPTSDLRVTRDALTRHWWLYWGAGGRSETRRSPSRVR